MTGLPSSLRRPQFLTFTGLDERTDLARAAALAARYPIEWAMLWSRSRAGCWGSPRYPSEPFIRDLAERRELPRLALHICGGWAREFMACISTGLAPPFALSLFNRIQINHSAPDPRRLRDLALARNVTTIGQSRSMAWPAIEPADTSLVDWLFDRSGGTGERPAAWPAHPASWRLVGYAGGIAPDNVVETITAIHTACGSPGPGPYWLDMESGVRSTAADGRDWLDLDKVEAVCRAVYDEGVAAAPAPAGGDEIPPPLHSEGPWKLNPCDGASVTARAYRSTAWTDPTVDTAADPDEAVHIAAIADPFFMMVPKPPDFDRRAWERECRANGRLVAAAPLYDTAARLALPALQAEREVLRSSWADPATGQVDEPDALAHLAELDAAIAALRAALFAAAEPKDAAPPGDRA